ncbi:MAG TPA: transcription antitermination factor NusB [bacterium]|nr:transcription antitermination factor NusB [bacterium]
MPRKQPYNARSLALRSLREVAQGAFAAEAIDHALREHPLAEADRGLLTQLVYGVLRERAFLDQVLSRYVSKAKTPEALLDLLRLGAYQCLSLEKVPDYAAVHEAVELAKLKHGSGAGRMANAVLRSLLREQTEIRAKLFDGRIESYPEWMLRRWRKRYPPERLKRMLEYFAAPAPLWARVNPRKAEAAGAAMIELGNRERSSWWQEMEAGNISIQDPHSYEVAMAVAPKDGEKILDACAGHGGKSSALAEIAPGMELYVHEPSPERIAQLGENFARLGIHQPTILSGPQAAADQELVFDAILVDAPCSGMGTLGRKPEIRWRLKPADLGRLAQKQRVILEGWIPRLGPAGRLIYAVCSLEPEEGRDNVATFLAGHPELRLEEERELFPEPGAGDGFYLARLARVK